MFFTFFWNATSKKRKSLVFGFKKKRKIRILKLWSVYGLLLFLPKPTVHALCGLKQYAYNQMIVLNSFWKEFGSSSTSVTDRNIRGVF